jgi:hypothetical protein
MSSLACPIAFPFTTRPERLELSTKTPWSACRLHRAADAALAGHLHWAKVESWFVNVYVLPAQRGREGGRERPRAPEPQPR